MSKRVVKNRPVFEVIYELKTTGALRYKKFFDPKKAFDYHWKQIHNGYTSQISTEHLNFKAGLLYTGSNLKSINYKRFKEKIIGTTLLWGKL